MVKVKAFLFANIPISVAHFILFLLARDQRWTNVLKVVQQPAQWLADVLGASSGQPIWWALMVLNSLVWGGVIAIFIAPALKKLVK